MNDKQKRYETSSFTYIAPNTMLIHKPLHARSYSEDASGAHMTLSQWWKGAGTATPPLESRTPPLFRCSERSVSFVLRIAVSVTHLLCHDGDRCVCGVLGEILLDLIAA
jgi:hypothetical protein